MNGRLLAGLLAGVAIGAALHAAGGHPARDWILTNVLEPLGQLFLRGLFMVVIPLIFCSLAAGVAKLGSVGHAGRLGGRLFVYYIGTSLVGIFIGQCLVSLIRPGDGIPPAFAAQAREAMATQVSGLMASSARVPESLWPGLIQQIVPRNIPQAMAEGNTLAVIFVAMLFGIALLRVEREKSEPMLRVLGAVSDAAIVVVGWIMRLAPFAVAALVAVAIARLGLDILRSVALYVCVVLVGYLTQFFVTYGLLVRFLAGCAPREFYRRALPVFLTAFSTSSSNATIPTSIRTLEENFGVPGNIATFSVPLGATVNMDGTALFEAVAALFIAQVFGVEISPAGQVTLVLLVLITSIGVAGIPGGSLPVLMSAMALLNIPPEGIALILGVDRLLDMGRTMVNVTGDLIGALYLARVERAPLRQGMEA